MILATWMTNAGYALGLASKGNPFVAVATVILFYFMFTVLEAGVEKLIFGNRFEHWLDPVFNVAFIFFAAVTVWQCAVINYNGGV